MKKIIKEQDFYNPNENSFRTTNINGHEYFYFIRPNDGKKIYANNRKELKKKVLDYQNDTKELFSKDISLMDAMLCWNHNIRYASKKDKEKFADSLHILSKRMNIIEGDKENFNVFNKPLFECSINDFILIINNVRLNAHKEASENLEDIIKDFIFCMRWLEIDIPEYDDAIENSLIVGSVKLDLKSTDSIKRQEDGYKKLYENLSGGSLTIYSNDLDLLDTELTVKNKVGKSKYKNEYIVILITMHTGIYANDAFHLRWKNIDLKNKRITTDDYEVSMDDLLYSVVSDYYKTQKIKNKNQFIFDTAKKDNTYSNVLTLYKTVQKNSLFPKDISLRDLSLIKGKEMISKGENPEKVCKILNITQNGTLWLRMQNIIIDPKKKTEPNPEFEELSKLVATMPPHKIKKIIEFAQSIK